MAMPKKPKLLYEVTIERKRYFRRFVWTLLAAVAAFGALVALNTALERNAADALLLTIGVVIAGIIGVAFGVRAFFSLGRWIRRRNETLKLFDQGFVWTKAGQENKYGWSTLKSYRDGGHAIYFRGKPVLQWGALKLTMQDGKVFKIGGVYGDLRQLGNLLRRPTAHVTGMQMGKTLREEKPVKLHPQLIVWPGGVQVGKKEIHWSEVDVKVKNNRLLIYRKNKSGKFSQVAKYDTHQVDNVGGFMEVAMTTIRNHQRERFGV